MQEKKTKKKLQKNLVDIKKSCIFALQTKNKLNMYKINHCFDKTKNCPNEFKTLKQAILYCDENFDEMYQIIKVVKDEILDIYELVLCAFVVTAHSCATGRTYSYFKW